MEKGISSTKIYTEALCETSFCSVHATYRVEDDFSLSSSVTLILLKLQVDIRSAKGPVVEKGISSNKNHKEAFCETSFCSLHSTNRVEAYF